MSRLPKVQEHMNEEQQREFEVLAKEYVEALSKMDNFIEANNLDYNKTWDKTNQLYDTRKTKEAIEMLLFGTSK